MDAVNGGDDRDDDESAPEDGATTRIEELLGESADHLRLGD